MPVRPKCIQEKRNKKSSGLKNRESSCPPGRSLNDILQRAAGSFGTPSAKGSDKPLVSNLPEVQSVVPTYQYSKLATSRRCGTFSLRNRQAPSSGRKRCSDVLDGSWEK
jgi:hypothetical protein